MDQVINRRMSGSHSELGFDNGNFYYCSFIGGIPELTGNYLRTDEKDYPAFGMSIMIICLTPQLREAASLVEKIAHGKPWLLVQWVVDQGRMVEHIANGQRWNDYGVQFDVRFARIGNCFYQDLANKYLKELKDAE